MKIDLKKERIDVKRVIALAIETSAPVIEAGHHQLTIDMPSEALPVVADSGDAAVRGAGEDGALVAALGADDDGLGNVAGDGDDLE